MVLQAEEVTAKVSDSIYRVVEAFVALLKSRGDCALQRNRSHIVAFFASILVGAVGVVLTALALRDALLKIFSEPFALVGIGVGLAAVSFAFGITRLHKIGGKL